MQNGPGGEYSGFREISSIDHTADIPGAPQLRENKRLIESEKPPTGEEGMGLKNPRRIFKNP